MDATSMYFLIWCTITPICNGAFSIYNSELLLFWLDAEKNPDQAESSNNTSTVHSTYHYRGQFFFSQNVFNSFSTIENWMRVMALSIYFGKTSIWMGRDNSIQIKITCKSKLCRNSQNWHCAFLCIHLST